MSDMMTCRDIFDEASSFIDGDLNPQRADSYRRHVDHCPPCADFHRSFTASITAAQVALATPPPKDLVEELTRGLMAQLRIAS